MGEAKRRGSFEDRKKQAIAAERPKRKEILFRKFKLTHLELYLDTANAGWLKSGKSNGKIDSFHIYEEEIENGSK